MTMLDTQKKLWWLTVGLVFMFAVVMLEAQCSVWNESELKEKIEFNKDEIKLTNDKIEILESMLSQLSPSLVQ